MKRFLPLLLLAACNGQPSIQDQAAPQKVERFISAEQMVENFTQTSLEDFVEADRSKLEDSRKIPPYKNPATGNSYIDANFNEADDVALLKIDLNSYNSPDSKVVDENTRLSTVFDLTTLHHKIKTQSGKDAYVSVHRGKVDYSFYIPSLGAGGLIKALPETQTLEVTIQAIEDTELPNPGYEKLLLKPVNGGWQ